MNRLADATSPYLRQHADNPVDWWPWIPEALEEAKRRNVPIHLSIGYAACHWCHVMARESFSDPAIADQLNRDFVNIKVDREERPDVDQIYMRALHALGEQGGWPLTMFLTPDARAVLGRHLFSARAALGPARTSARSSRRSRTPGDAGDDAVTKNASALREHAVGPAPRSGSRRTLTRRSSTGPPRRSSRSGILRAAASRAPRNSPTRRCSIRSGGRSRAPATSATRRR